MTTGYRFKREHRTRFGAACGKNNPEKPKAKSCMCPT